MKKRNFVTLALFGISAAVLVGGCEQTGNKSNRMAAAERLSQDMQTFYNSLSPQAQKQFMEMDAQHRMMAMQMANSSCEGQNQCQGMGGCAGLNHDCAGKNDCKGQGAGPVGDPNRAVDIQYKNQMEDQRGQMNDGMSGQTAPANGMRRGYGRSY